MSRRPHQISEVSMWASYPYLATGFHGVTGYHTSRRRIRDPWEPRDPSPHDVPALLLMHGMESMDHPMA